MKTPVETMNLLWPTGIPPQDYAKVARLVAADAVADRVLGSANDVPTAPAVPAPPPKPKVETAQDKVVAALKAGNATMRELASSTRLSTGTIKKALHSVAIKVGERENRHRFGQPAIIYGLKAATAGMSDVRARVGNYAGPESIEKVRAVLSTGPATAKEVADATHLSASTVWAALTVVAKAQGSQRSPAGGRPAALYVLKDAA